MIWKILSEFLEAPRSWLYGTVLACTVILSVGFTLAEVKAGWSDLVSILAVFLAFACGRASK